MLKPTIVTWIIALFGAVIFLILFMAGLVILFKPQSQRAKDIFIGKGKEWRDRTHFKSAYAFAWGDILVIMPLLISGHIGVLTGQLWGYLIWIVLGTISIYFSIVFWVMEKEYTYTAYGPLAYYTYVWGFYLYWGIAVLIYSVLRIKV